MPDSKNEKVVKMRPRFRFNIGVLIFLIIFAYVMYFIVRYFTAVHISSYMVENGSLVQEDTYTGLCIRDETISYASGSGKIIYYATASERVGAHTLVYSLDPGGIINSIIDSDDAGKYIYADDYTSIAGLIKAFDLAYDPLSFDEVYDLKKNVNSALREAMNTNALDALTESGDVGGVLSLSYSSRDGIVEYYTDGYETLVSDNISIEMIDPTDYTPIVLESNVSIESGDAVYKLVTDEDWSVAIEVSDDMAAQLEDMGTVYVTFQDDHNSAYAKVSINNTPDGNIAILQFSNSMERYADKRYLDIKLNLDTITGLKVPVSAIIEKEFLVVPTEYATLGGNSSETGFLVEETDEDGNKSAVFKSPSISYESDGYYYIDDKELAKGSIIYKPDSADTYVANRTRTLSGTYCINKGYAVFKKIDILYSNDEYAIVVPGLNYGLSLYDYIALDATSVTEGAIIN